LFAKVRPDERIEREHDPGRDDEAKHAEDFVTMQNDIRAHLMKAGKPAFVEETFVSFDDCASADLGTRRYPVLPTLVDGASPIAQFEESPDS